MKPPSDRKVTREATTDTVAEQEIHTPSITAPDLTDIDSIYSTVVELTTIRIRRDPAFASRDRFEPRDRGDMLALARAIYAQCDEGQEHFVLLPFDSRGRIIGYKVIASGERDRVSVDVSLLFRNALLMDGFKIVVIHNHPDGSTAPSLQDLALTHRLVMSGMLLEMPVIDHYIYDGDRELASIRMDHGYLWPLR